MIAESAAMDMRNNAELNSRFGCKVDTAAALLLLAVAASAGCGGAGTLGDQAPVTGNVTFKGEPVIKGSIDFYNEEKGVAASAQLASDGTYSVRTADGAGLWLGTYKVSINPPPPPANPANDGLGLDVPPVEQEHPDIPPKYRDINTSGLTAEVKEGSNTFDFDMQPE